MKRLLCIVSALSLSAAACAEQPGKKKEEDNKDGKVESRPVEGGGKPTAKTDAKPADK